MNSTEPEGVAKEVVGEFKEKAGAVLGDPAMELSGKAKALCGQSQQMVADAAEVAREAIAESPLRVLAITLGVGVVLGALWSKSRS